MHACPSSDELQNFLDEAIDADYIARILAHIEDCYLCQQSLERLTVGGSAIREGLPPPLAAATELESTADPNRTGIFTREDQPSRKIAGTTGRPRQKRM